MPAAVLAAAFSLVGLAGGEAQHKGATPKTTPAPSSSRRRRPRAEAALATPPPSPKRRGGQSSTRRKTRAPRDPSGRRAPVVARVDRGRPARARVYGPFLPPSELYDYPPPPCAPERRRRRGAPPRGRTADAGFRGSGAARRPSTPPPSRAARLDRVGPVARLASAAQVGVESTRHARGRGPRASCCRPDSGSPSRAWTRRSCSDSFLDVAGPLPQAPGDRHRGAPGHAGARHGRRRDRPARREKRGGHHDLPEGRHRQVPPLLLPPLQVRRRARGWAERSRRET